MKIYRDTYSALIAVVVLAGLITWLLVVVNPIR